MCGKSGGICEEIVVKCTRVIITEVKDKLMWQKTCLKTRNIAEWVILVMACIILCYITVVSFLYHFDGVNSVPLSSSVIGVIMAVIIYGAVILLLTKLLTPLHNKYPFVDKILLALSLAWICGFSITFINGAKVLPDSDPRSVYDIAVRMYNGDMGAVVPTGSYLSLCPYQTGLIFIFEKIMRVFGTTDPVLLQYCNVFYVALATVSGYGLLKNLTKRLEVILGYLVLISGFLPMFVYTTYIYGDVPSMALILFSGWMFLGFDRTFEDQDAGNDNTGNIVIGKKFVLKQVTFLRWAYGLLGMGASILACTYRRNSLIYVIALAAICVVRLLVKYNWKLMAWIAIIALLSILSTTVTQKYYEFYAQNECGPGIPSIAYVAMGMQEGVAAPGFWNGFHANTYMTTDYNYEETNRISQEAIAESWQNFMDNPAYMANFYFLKITCQWADASYGCFNHVEKLYLEDRSDFALSIMHGEKHLPLLQFMDMHQFVVYFYALIAVVATLIQRIKGQHLNLFSCPLLVTIIGGFLFSIIWEASAKYTIPYMLFLIPIAAYGMLTILKLMGKIVNKKKG